MTIYEKLLHVQQNLKAPKNQYNQFGDYHYRSCEDIQEALKPLLAEVGAVLLVSDEIIMIGDRFYVKATAVFQDAKGYDNGPVQERNDNIQTDGVKRTGSGTI